MPPRKPCIKRKVEEQPTINYGGSAFPCEGGVDSGLYPDPGMSLRDWFAGRALAGHLASMNPGGIDASFAAKCAEDAYRVADAMIAEREKSR